MKARTGSLKTLCKTNKPPENLLGQSRPPEQTGVGGRGWAGPRRKVPFVPAFLTSPSRASSLGELKYWGRCCLEVSPDAETRGGDAGPSRGNEQPGQRGGPAGCRGGQLSRQSPRESTPPWGLCQTCTTPTPTPTRQPGRSSRPRSQDEESSPARPQRPPHPGGDGVRGWGAPVPTQHGPPVRLPWHRAGRPWRGGPWSRDPKRQRPWPREAGWGHQGGESQVTAVEV